jgi:hypothetical protein
MTEFTPMGAGLQRWVIKMGGLIDQELDGKHPDYRYPSMYHLLMDKGRWFEPLEEFAEIDPRGQCYDNALSRCEEDPSLVYVEGLASTELFVMGTEHAWCGEGYYAIDTTWAIGEGTGYLGLPLTLDFVNHHRKRSGFATVLFPESKTRLEILRHGIPEDALVDDVGVPFWDLGV